MKGGKRGRREGKKKERKEVTHNTPSEANGSQGNATGSSTHAGHGTAQKRYLYRVSAGNHKRVQDQRNQRLKLGFLLPAFPRKGRKLDRHFAYLGEQKRLKTHNTDASALRADAALLFSVPRTALTCHPDKVSAGNHKWAHEQRNQLLS